MHKRILYCCDLCDFTSADPERVELHEAEHEGFTHMVWKEYMRLQMAVRDAGRAVHYTKNEKTDNAFDKAVQDVLAFEEKHKIPEETRKKYRY